MARPRYPYIPASLNRKQRWRRLLRRVLIAAAIVCVLIVGAAVWLSRSLPGIVAAEIGRLTNTRVEAGAFGLRLDGSVSIDGLVIRPRQEEPGYDNAILRAKNVYARFSRRSLVVALPARDGTPHRGFRARRAVGPGYRSGGTSGPCSSSDPAAGTEAATIPAIQLQRGKLRYCKVSGGNAEVVDVRAGRGTLRDGVGPAGLRIRDQDVQALRRPRRKPSQRLLAARRTHAGRRTVLDGSALARAGVGGGCSGRPVSSTTRTAITSWTFA